MGLMSPRITTIPTAEAKVIQLLRSFLASFSVVFAALVVKEDIKEKKAPIVWSFEEVRLDFESHYA
jgi:hypothetical protein